MTGRLALHVMLVAALATPLYAQKIADERSRRQALEFYRAGQEFMTAERFELAAQAFSNAIDKDALLTVAHYQLGQAYMNLKRYAVAIQAYEGCIDALSQLHRLEQSSKFDVDRQRDEEIRELRTEIDQVKNISPLKRSVMEQRLSGLEQQRVSYAGVFHPPAFVLLALGSAFFRSGDLPSAEREWKAAIDVDAKFGEAHNNLAALYAMSGRRQEAEEAVKQAEQSGFKVNPKLKSDIRALPK
jgi:tetratricopeptide (TPR) repeat protein